MTQTLKNYEKNERYLATRLFAHFNTIKEYSFTEGHICYDFLIKLIDDKTIIGEIKVRNFKTDKYPDYILQVDKLIGLIKRATRNNYDKIYYVNFFKSEDNTRKEFIIFDLTVRIKEWKVNRPTVKRMLMNAETHKSTEVKVFKDVILLKYDENIDMRGNFSLN